MINIIIKENFALIISFFFKTHVRLKRFILCSFEVFGTFRDVKPGKSQSERIAGCLKIPFINRLKKENSVLPFI
jgi:hypothetical protein